MNEKYINSIIEKIKISSKEFSEVLNIEDEITKLAISKLLDEKINTAVETAIGLNNNIITAIIEVSVKTEGGCGFDKTAQKIAKHPEVKNVYLTSGNNDITIIMEACSLKEISNFVSEKLSILSLVNSTNTKVILKKYKENGEIIPTEEENDERLILSI